MKTRYLKNTLGVLLVTMVSVTAANAKDKGPKVGMAVQDLSNPTWAGYCQAIKRRSIPRVEI